MTETITIGVAPNEKSFVPQKNLPDGRVRINDATTLLEPELLTIRHSTSRGGSGNPKQAVVDRHLVQASRTLRDSETGEEYQATVNMTFIVPRHASFDATAVGALQNDVVYTLGASGTLEAVLRGES